jgi:hypothetical protein
MRRVCNVQRQRRDDEAKATDALRLPDRPLCGHHLLARGKQIARGGLRCDGSVSRGDASPSPRPMSVSIVISNHNYGHFVADAVESAVAQTHRDLQVIVVDDGSTDDSLEILSGYPSVTLVAQENRGQAGALNAGLKLATGAVVIFLDADDMLAPTTAAVVAEVFERRPDVVKVMYRLQVVDANGVPTGELKPPAHLPLRSGDLRPYELRFPFDMTWMATSGNAFRTSALERIFPIDEREYPLCADWYLSHLTPLIGLVEFLDTVGGEYRFHGANNYERQTGRLDLEQVRQTIVYARRTAQHLVDLARELDLDGRPATADDVIAVSEIWQRLLSLRLEPGLHSIPSDSRARLLALGLRAARRRFDVSLWLRAALAAWVLAVGLAPRPLLPVLVRMLSVRDNPRLTSVLSRLHRGT